MIRIWYICLFLITSNSAPSASYNLLSWSSYIKGWHLQRRDSLGPYLCVQTTNTKMQKLVELNIDTISLLIHNTCYRRYFLPAIFWMLVIWITNTHHVSVGCKIVGNGEESGYRINYITCLHNFKSHWTLNISYTKQFNHWPSPGNQQSLVFLLRALLSVTGKNHFKRWLIMGAWLPWRSVNSLPGCVSTGQSNRKDSKTHGNHYKHVLCRSLPTSYN